MINNLLKLGFGIAVSTFVLLPTFVEARDIKSKYADKLIESLEDTFGRKGILPKSEAIEEAKYFVNERGFKKKLRYRIEDGPFLWSTDNKPFAKDGSWPRKAIMNICTKDFDGVITHTDTIQLNSLAKKNRFGKVKIPTRDLSVYLSSIKETALMNPNDTLENSKYVSEIMGLYTCNLDAKPIWSVHIDFTKFRTRYAVSGGAFISPTIISILPVDENVSPLFEANLESEGLKKLYEFNDRLVAINKDNEQKRIQEEERQRRVLVQLEQEKADARKKEALLANLTSGVETNCGLVVEVKDSVVLVQPAGLNKVAQ